MHRYANSLFLVNLIGTPLEISIHVSYAYVAD